MALTSATTIFCETLCNKSVTLSNPKVFVRQKLQPCSKARRIIETAVVGGAEANPNGFSNFNPHISTEISTRSIAVKNNGSSGFESNGMP